MAIPGRRASSATGRFGTVSAAHPAAVEAGLEILRAGGNAVDAALAAQAVLAVVIPDACGLGGDGLALVREPDGTVTAVNGVGRSAALATAAASTGGESVTVPGLVGAWAELSARWGRTPLAQVLAPAVRTARYGLTVDAALSGAVEVQRERLLAGGAADWTLLAAAQGQAFVQPRLADLLERIGAAAFETFYTGPIAVAVAAAVRRHGGQLHTDDLARHRTAVLAPVAVDWDGGTVHVQPPSSQGVLLAMALAWLDREGRPDPAAADHIGVELTEAVFGSRSEVVARGAQLLDVPLEVDRGRAAHRSGPRAYLHTAGVATADRDGLVVSSLVSVFDDFGSAVYVPEGGFVLNNRAGGFTDGANAFAPGARPVHTLAPALVETSTGPVAVATPGADGQVQSLLQVLLRRAGGSSWAEAIGAPRWRSEDGDLLVEAGHGAAGRLAALGHHTRELVSGDSRFGAVVCAGLQSGELFAVADHRRTTTAGGW